MKKNNLSILEVSPNNIWNYKQNHPELVIKDLEKQGINEDVQDFVRKSMLARGINKWLKVRRDLIAYKKNIRHEVKKLMEEVPILKQDMTDKWINFRYGSKQEIHEYYKAREKYLIAKELLKYKQKVRGDLKALCMTERWQLWRGKKLDEMNTINASD